MKLINEAFMGEKVDVVCSDACPKLLGERTVDQINAANLNLEVLDVCKSQLRKGGKALIKVF